MNSPFASSEVEKPFREQVRGSTSLDPNGRVMGTGEQRMAFYAYMLRCADGRYYTGHTDDLERRIGQHQTGGYCAFTSTRRPVGLVWSEAFPSRLEALEAERIVGGWSRAKKEALIRSDWGAVSYFARPPREREEGFSTSLEANGRSEVGQTGLSLPPFASSEVGKPVASTTP